MMITWDLFLPFAAVSVILWTAGVAATFCNKDRCSKVALWCTAIGVIISLFSRSTREDRYGFPNLWNALRLYLGKTGMGQLLDLGPQGDMGSSYMVRIFSVYSPPHF